MNAAISDTYRCVDIKNAAIGLTYSRITNATYIGSIAAFFTKT